MGEGAPQGSFPAEVSPPPGFGSFCPSSVGPVSMKGPGAGGASFQSMVPMGRCKYTVSQPLVASGFAATPPEYAHKPRGACYGPDACDRTTCGMCGPGRPRLRARLLPTRPP